MPVGRGALVDELRAAVRAERFAVLRHVEKDARMPRPQRRGRRRAVQRQILLGHLDEARFVRALHAAHCLPFFIGTGVSQWRCFLSLPLTTSKNAFCSAFVTGPARPAPIWRPSSSRIGVTSAAVPVKNASSAM